MGTPKASDGPPSSPTPPASSRTSDAAHQYDSSSDGRVSSMDEKRSLEYSSSETASTSLLEARELEAQPEVDPAPPEDLVPRRTKIIFVALYFFLNLSLTLSNKSVLSKVRAILPAASTERPGIIVGSQTSTDHSPVEPAMASHDITYNRHIDRHLRLDGNGPLDIDATELSLASDTPWLLSAVHSQHRNLQRLSRHGVRAIPSSNAVHMSSRHNPHLPYCLRSRLQ